MPPKIRFAREQVVDAALDVVRAKGSDALCARAVAKQLGCSTQPIFHALRNMAELRAAVLEKATAIYDDYIERSKKDVDVPPYKAAGIAYIRFAREEPALFRLVFMRDRKEEEIPHESDDHHIDYILQTVSKMTGLSREDAYRFHLCMWIYTHGLAVMVATGYLRFSEEEISTLLGEEYIALKGRFLTPYEENH